MDEIVSIDTQCSSCKGTGIYVGACERDGAGVVCNICKGTGKLTLNYIPFKGRQLRNDVKRVFEGSSMYIIYANDYEDYGWNGETIHFSQMGIPYEDWLKGGQPLPLRELVCPLQHTGQEFKWRLCNDLHGGFISDCPHHKELEKCWAAYDRKVKKNGTDPR
jgi:hypothetical protein